MPFVYTYGRFTSPTRKLSIASYDEAKPQKHSATWSASEYTATYSWYVNFSSGNVNNNNKNNTNVSRAVAAYEYATELFANPDSEESFEKLYESVKLAYLDCRRNKACSKQAIDYTYIADDDLYALTCEMWNGTYVPTTSTCFLVDYPKLREIFAADFRDRIVHHWIINKLNSLFEERFTSQGNVSYNCRTGFGTKRCVSDTIKGIERVTENYTKEAWIYKFDIQGFFMSISKSLLWSLLEKFITRKYKGPFKNILLNLVKTTVMHHPEDNCVINTYPRKWRKLETNKSLFTQDDDKGEPIGNLTTQHFANFYMSYLDQYILYLFRFKNFEYKRFVDDMLIICDDKKFLLKQRKKIEKFLKEKLGLTLHPTKQYFQPAKHGVNFIGSSIRPHRTHISNRTIGKAMSKIHGFNTLMESKEVLGIYDLKRIEAVMNSYLGFCRQYRKSYKIKQKIVNSFCPTFWKYFFAKTKYNSIRIKPAYRTK